MGFSNTGFTYYEAEADKYLNTDVIFLNMYFIEITLHHISSCFYKEAIQTYGLSKP